MSGGVRMSEEQYADYLALHSPRATCAGSMRAVDPRVAPQPSLLEPREMCFELPLPLSVNEAWHHDPYYDDRDGKLKVRTVLTKEHREFRTRVISLVGLTLRKRGGDRTPLAGRLALQLLLHFTDRRRTDIDNRVKPLQDALTHAKAYHDDSQIDDLDVKRIVDTGPERCVVTLKEIA